MLKAFLFLFFTLTTNAKAKKSSLKERKFLIIITVIFAAIVVLFLGFKYINNLKKEAENYFLLRRYLQANDLEKKQMVEKVVKEIPWFHENFNFENSSFSNFASLLILRDLKFANDEEKENFDLQLKNESNYKIVQNTKYLDLYIVFSDELLYLVDKRQMNNSFPCFLCDFAWENEKKEVCNVFLFFYKLED